MTVIYRIDNRSSISDDRFDGPRPAVVDLVIKEGLDNIQRIIAKKKKLSAEEKKFLELLSALHHAFKFQQAEVLWDGRSLKLEKALDILNHMRRNLVKNSNHAMTIKQKENTGGIDLTPGNFNLQTQNNGAEIKFHMDPALLQQLQNASGFVPEIINIQPLNNLQQFLGLGDAKVVKVG